MEQATVLMSNFKSFSKANFGIPLLLMMMLGMMVLPLPPFLLDILFTFNIVLSLVVILACLYCTRPLDFSIFPTILLVATLLRLSLNVASTRVVLLNGHLGNDAAGQVIEAFGEVVIGGSYTVGIVVFAILVIINFVVVTKGAGRISEVSARFTLDAMPGKQMAIDADLNAGLITQEEAKKRRVEVAQEADFYGAMDGASKFVRGDAIAGLLILFINMIGGIIIGITQYNMNISSAAHNYTLLTIGDGLAAQIPSLLLSCAAAIMVTRVNSEQDMGKQIIDQLFSSSKVLIITAVIMGTLGLIPGMPHLPFLGLTAMIVAFLIFKQEKKSTGIANTEKQAHQKALDLPPKELDWNDVQPVDPIGLEIGYRVISLVDSSKDGQLMNRIKGIRKKLSQELGFLIPAIHIKDNLELSPNAYKISLFGVSMAEGDIYPDKELAINPGQVFGTLEGMHVKDPAFNLDATWIPFSQREHAQSLGYTVVDASTVIATHLNQILSQHSYEIIGHEEVQQLVNRLSASTPKLAEALVPGALSLSVIVKVLQLLLEDQIPLVDFRTIAETLVTAANKSQDPDVLTSMVRIALKRLIFQSLNGNNLELSVITLSPELEQILQQSKQLANDSGFYLEPSLAEKLYTHLSEFEKKQSLTGEPAIVVVSPSVRPFLGKFVKHSIPGIRILSYQEIPDDKQIKVIGVIGQ